MASLRAWALEADCEVVGRRFLACGLGFLAVGGLLALLLRVQLGWPGAGVLSPTAHATTFTLHGLVMVFWALTPCLVAAPANAVLPSLLGASRTAHPALGAWSFWLFLASGLLLLASLAGDAGGPMAGWTSYPPLASQVGAPGAGQSIALVALILAGMGLVAGGANTIATVIRARADGLRLATMPLTAWGLLLAAMLTCLFVPVVAVASGLLLLDRCCGTSFFLAGAAAGGMPAGDPLLYQHLFWIFGHPEVYVLILPAWGIVGDLVAARGRQPPAFRRLQAGALVAITALSGLVYGHHLFTSRLQPMASGAFMTLTLLISLPATLLVLAWLHGLASPALRLDAPLLFALGSLILFGLGGLTGTLLGSPTTNIPLHDTMYVVGHFHLTLAGASLMATFAGLHWWAPRLLGHALDERLGRWHAALTFAFLAALTCGLLAAGWSGQPRRLFDPYAYELTEPLRGLGVFTSVAGLLLGAAQLLLVANLALSARRARAAGPRS